ncbi:1-phosphofructokinase family hexose kinase [Mycolicibacterium fluoranthenivorans]|uniref:1-phosphofructokinase n=1 Tax=Mycolicibacterium fluoranthenivorans TaxID=258505 RepID=A0A7X5TUW5_9MYCO|nr:1-phosphofructokinase family hexose kinase [Mycolicibacterium fluoranthenivorans]MCV7359472.1 1-phosphofructokinase family hexose kinase [Mycolicibacterium fluoranthenivorans]NIH93439.1 1-phosphofructokinase [Mycolicibacterium fluoranthenivorans]
MIVTVTPNPSIDRTVTLGTPLTRGAVHRIGSVTNEPGGKGVNVARALGLAGLDTIAVLPASDADLILAALRAAGVPFRNVPIRGQVRTNLAITESDGTTTKLNEPGAPFEAAALQELTHTVLQAAQGASWVVLSGSLPPGIPVHWYADMVAALSDYDCHVAVDTSDAPLAALAAGFGTAAPDVIKPNAEELAGLTGHSAAELESAAAQGDTGPVVAAARQLIDRGAAAVLVTLGAAGAVLVDGDGSWLATPPPIVPRSTVGAGDSSLAGYVRAALEGAPPAQRLQMAVAYGSVAAALPGSALPAPSQINTEAVAVRSLSPSAA